MTTSGRDPQRDETQVIRDERAAESQPQRTETTAGSAWPEGIDPYTLVAIIGSVVGAIVLIIGIVTLARTGVPANITEARTAVGPFERTALMGIIEILVGLAFIGAGAGRNAAGLFALGLFSSVFGIVWLIEPNAFNDALGVNRATAWFYLLVGIASAVIGGWANNQPRSTVVVRR